MPWYRIVVGEVNLAVDVPDEALPEFQRIVAEHGARLEPATPKVLGIGSGPSLTQILADPKMQKALQPLLQPRVEPPIVDIQKLLGECPRKDRSYRRQKKNGKKKRRSR